MSGEDGLVVLSIVLAQLTSKQRLAAVERLREIGYEKAAVAIERGDQRVGGLS